MSIGISEYHLQHSRLIFDYSMKTVDFILCKIMVLKLHGSWRCSSVGTFVSRDARSKLVSEYKFFCFFGSSVNRVPRFDTIRYIPASHVREVGTATLCYL